MPTATYIALANLTLTGTASDVTFSSIPATYRDLVLVIDGTFSSDNNEGYIQFNADTGSNYPQVGMRGYGASVTQSASSTETGIYTYGRFQTNQNNAIYHIMDYSATDKHKTVLLRSSSGNASNSFVTAVAGRWASTNAITSIKFELLSGTASSGTTFALYGIAS